MNNDSDELFNSILDRSPLLKSINSLAKGNKPDVKELTPEQRVRNFVDQVMEMGKAKPDKK